MRYVCLLLLSAMVWTTAAEPAEAVLAFYKVWEGEYLANHPDEEYRTFVKKGANRCYVCHVGKKRTHRNAYGALMENELEWKKDAKDKEKVLAVIKKAGEGHFDPNNESSETFLQRIEASKLPAGELEELKKEPAE